jgi:hypothetical protein
MEDRISAVAFAKKILSQLRVPEADVIYLEAVIEAAAMFEIPLRDLKVAVNDVGHMYHITIQGYDNIIDLVMLTNTFVGNNRGVFLSNVVGLLMHMTDKAFIVQMEKVRYMKASSGSGIESTKARLKKRGA